MTKPLTVGEMWTVTKFPNIGNLGRIQGNLVIYTTKFPYMRPSLIFFSKNILIKHLSKKTFQENLAFFLKSFCAKDGICSSKTVGGDRFLVLKNKHGRYHDQVSTNMTMFPKA